MDLISNISWSHVTAVIKLSSGPGKETSAGKREGEYEYVLKERWRAVETACFSEWCSGGKFQVCNR